MVDTADAETLEPQKPGERKRMRIAAFLVLLVMVVYFLGASGVFGVDKFLMAGFTVVAASALASVIVAMFSLLMRR
jgi:hypothetical protein